VLPHAGLKATLLLQSRPLARLGPPSSPASWRRNLSLLKSEKLHFFTLFHFSSKSFFLLSPSLWNWLSPLTNRCSDCRSSVSMEKATHLVENLQNPSPKTIAKARDGKLKIHGTLICSNRRAHHGHCIQWSRDVNASFNMASILTRSFLVNKYTRPAHLSSQNKIIKSIPLFNSFLLLLLLLLLHSYRLQPDQSSSSNVLLNSS